MDLQPMSGMSAVPIPNDKNLHRCSQVRTDPNVT